MKRSKLFALAFLGMVLLASLVEPSHAADQLYVTVYTDKESYDPGELVSIGGHVLDGNSMPMSFARVSVQANDPSGKPIHVALLLSSADGSYTDQFTAPPNSVNGGYAIYVTASKPGYIDAYSQAACTVTPEFSHLSWMVFFIAVLAVLVARGQKSRPRGPRTEDPMTQQDCSERSRSILRWDSPQGTKPRSEDRLGI